ncbi:MAG: hypothetical protein VW080_02180 [Flavobacteriaceae bacterium]
MKKNCIYLLSISFLFYGCDFIKQKPIVKLSTDHCSLSIDSKGEIDTLVVTKNRVNYLDNSEPSSLISIRIDSTYYVPEKAIFKNDTLILTYKPSVIAKVKIEEKESHLTFELVSIEPESIVDLVVWGPYFNSIDQIIGETVGVVRGTEFSLGIQSLNLKTLGGYPWNESDRMPPFDIMDQPNPNEMNPKNAPHVLYRVEAAKPTPNGSSLQAYTRNRSKERIVKEFNHDQILVPPYQDGGLKGSKIALFGSPVNKALETIGEIELAEGLPHPLMDGKWIKTNPKVASSYIIMDFKEHEIEKALDITEKAGLEYLYYYGKTFESWGHFELSKTQFPEGRKGLKKMVQKAQKRGIKLGIHTLSNFITINDAYVTPVPDKRLAVVGASKLVRSIDSLETEIEIQAPHFFNQMKNNTLQTVRIGSELIRYESVSKEAPWKLLDCQRGAFGTEKTAYDKGTDIVKLLDHPYKVFLTNADLTIEMSQTLANLYNETGLRQISFDGLEGNRSTGLGTYGESLMPATWYNHLNEYIKKHLVVDASRTTHFFWHIYSRMNWGEPWYAGFRESQTAYRLKNQSYFKRNFMPGMLGWFLMKEQTSIEDMEWLLARSAGFDAGFSFVTSFESISKNGNSESILNLLKTWEQLRLSGAFSKEQKREMQNPEKEFTLMKNTQNKWNLHPVNSSKFIFKPRERQPGEPRDEVYKFENKDSEQIFQFILQAKESDLFDIQMELNGYKKIEIPSTLKKGQNLAYKGGTKAVLYDSNWNALDEISVTLEEIKINPGIHTIRLSCDFDSSTENSAAKLEIRVLEKGQPIND